eukprot:CAMPEP_0114024750 /NCGR_PEP_ID=MMETSP1159-20121227/1234_1 /TAXON_ID=88271 /ORGANISM="Picocystis salinarum" /LENGTH=31 /assembly_acc=CAM_ASM_000767
MATLDTRGTTTHVHARSHTCGGAIRLRPTRP